MSTMEFKVLDIADFQEVEVIDMLVGDQITEGSVLAIVEVQNSASGNEDAAERQSEAQARDPAFT